MSIIGGAVLTAIMGAVSDASAGNLVERLVPKGIVPYLQLARADRPIGFFLLALPCFWSVALAGGSIEAWQYNMRFRPSRIQRPAPRRGGLWKPFRRTQLCSSGPPVTWLGANFFLAWRIWHCQHSRPTSK